jgi:hypothetical protein
MREIAGQIPKNSLELISTIVWNVAGVKVSSLEHITGLGMNNSVSVAETSSGRLVVRTNVESHLFRFQREAWCYRRLEGSPVLTPKVLACGIAAGHSYSVAQYIEGSAPIGDGIDRLKVWKTLGMYASYLNQVVAPAANCVESSYFPISWEEQVALDVDLIFKDEFWLQRGVLTLKQQELMRGYLLDCANNAFMLGVCQFDLTIANAVICEADYKRIFLLDLESANIAPVPYYQLACIAADQGPTSEAYGAFLAGYGLKNEAQAASELNRFTLYRVLRAAAWARDRCPSLIEENLRRSRPIIELTLAKYIAEAKP